MANCYCYSYLRKLRLGGVLIVEQSSVSTHYRVHIRSCNLLKTN